jgi:hypothetical protein
MSTEDISKDKIDMEEPSVFHSDIKLRKIARWGTVLGTLVLGGFLSTFLLIQTFKPINPNTNWLITQLNQHFAATIGIPLSALLAFCIVTLLRATTGPIEIGSEFIKFRGASGPIIFWILCFIVIIIGVKLLWMVSPCP